MAKHVLTREEKIRGLRAALASRRTPRQLRAGLKSHLEVLERGEGSARGKRRGRPKGFLGFFTL